MAASPKFIFHQNKLCSMRQHLMAWYAAYVRLKFAEAKKPEQIKI